MAYDTARLESAKGFVQNVAKNLSERVGNTNLGEQVQLDPSSIRIDPNGNYHCEMRYGKNNEARTLEITAEGKVLMTDLAHPDIANNRYTCELSEL